MYKHLETLILAGVEQRLLDMFMREQDQVVSNHPELLTSFQAIPIYWDEWRSPKQPGAALLRLRYLYHTGGDSPYSRYDHNGIARYHYNDTTAYFFRNNWLAKPIEPFEIVKEIVSRVHRKGAPGVMMEDEIIKLERIDQSDYWPVFWQEEKDKHAWVVTRLLDALRLPSDFCPHCGRGGDLKWIGSKRMLLGAVWGRGDKCLGDGYVVFEVTRKSDLRGKI